MTANKQSFQSVTYEDMSEAFGIWNHDAEFIKNDAHDDEIAAIENIRTVAESVQQLAEKWGVEESVATFIIQFQEYAKSKDVFDALPQPEALLAMANRHAQLRPFIYPLYDQDKSITREQRRFTVMAMGIAHGYIGYGLDSSVGLYHDHPKRWLAKSILTFSFSPRYIAANYKAMKQVHAYLKDRGLLDD